MQQRAKKDMVVWKKAYVVGTRDWCGGRAVVVKLLIKKGTRWNGPGHYASKCRAAKAKVLGFKTRTGKALRLKKGQRVYSMYDPKFFYRKGRIVKPRDRYSMSEATCESGIHFFRHFQLAANY